MQFDIYQNGIQVGVLEAADEEAARDDLREDRVFGVAESELDVRPSEPTA